LMALIVALMFGCAATRQLPPAIKELNLHRIERGMSRQVVENELRPVKVSRGATVSGFQTSVYWVRSNVLIYIEYKLMHYPDSHSDDTVLFPPRSVDVLVENKWERFNLDPLKK
jgi:hypothetical protein